MKEILVLLLGIVILSSCDPDIPGEGINLPPMEFAFKVNPDTAYLKVGDTFSMHASLSNTLSNGVKLTDGEGEIWVYISRGDEIPLQNPDDNHTATNNIDFIVLIDGGGEMGKR